MNFKTKHMGWMAVGFAEPLADVAVPPTDGLVCAELHGSGEDDDSQQALIAAIARELSTFRGGALKRHLPEARRLLEQAFRRIEQCKETLSAA